VKQVVFSHKTTCFRAKNNLFQAVELLLEQLVPKIEKLLEQAVFLEKSDGYPCHIFATVTM
jgi:hypothetical protein